MLNGNKNLVNFVSKRRPAEVVRPQRMRLKDAYEVCSFLSNNGTSEKRIALRLQNSAIRTGYGDQTGATRTYLEHPWRRSYRNIKTPPHSVRLGDSRCRVLFYCGEDGNISWYDTASRINFHMDTTAYSVVQVVATTTANSTVIYVNTVKPYYAMYTFRRKINPDYTVRLC